MYRGRIVKIEKKVKMISMRGKKKRRGRKKQWQERKNGKRKIRSSVIREVKPF